MQIFLSIPGHDSHGEARARLPRVHTFAIIIPTTDKTPTRGGALMPGDGVSARLCDYVLPPRQSRQHLVPAAGLRAS